MASAATHRRAPFRFAVGFIAGALTLIGCDDDPKSTDPLDVAEGADTRLADADADGSGSGPGDAGEGDPAERDAGDVETDAEAGVDTAADGAGGEEDAVADGSGEDAGPRGPTPDERFGAPPNFADGEQVVSDLFDGVRILSRTTSAPRPLVYHVVQIDTDAEGLSFRMTAPNGDAPRETTRQTVRGWVEQNGAQLGFNTHFFTPWPPEDGFADCLGFAASDGEPYSTFSAGWPLAIVLGPDNTATFVRRDEADASGFGMVPAVEVDDAFGAREQIVTAGANTGTWDELHPRTAAGVTDDGELVFMVVDGRQDGVSEGMTTPEVADVLIALGVVDALNLDGGGSSTLVVADPVARVFNVPVGFALPRTERDNGCNLAVFATPR